MTDAKTLLRREQNAARGASARAIVPGGLPLLLRDREVAALLGLGRSMVRRMMRSGELTTVPIGRARRVPTAELHAWVARRVAGSTAGHR